jgi:hypothetical protein
MKPSENQKICEETRRGNKTARRKVVLSSVLFTAISCLLYANLLFSQDYSHLVELIKLEDRETPLYVFNDFENEFDEKSHKANLEYVNDHPDLIMRIKEDLGGGEIRWRLDTFMHRLLFVPEVRKEYATIFKDYCYDVIGYVLDKMNLSNPYRKIQTLDQERPVIPDSGVAVFLVHNLAREFIGRYIFSNNTKRKVKIDLKGIVFLGEVGSYTTRVYVRDNGKLEFVRDNYTIWQNSAKNPYTTLMVPVEETLHIALREHTERAIKEHLQINPSHRKQEVEKVAGELIATEEAVVGGLVHGLLPSFLKGCVPKLPYSLVQEDIESKCGLRQYRHLRRGIAIVERLGHRNALEMYSRDPKGFMNLLM